MRLTVSVDPLVPEHQRHLECISAAAVTVVVVIAVNARTAKTI